MEGYLQALPLNQHLLLDNLILIEVGPPYWEEAVLDEMFLEGMKSTKVNWLRRNAMWLAVRVGGKGQWG